MGEWEREGGGSRQSECKVKSDRSGCVAPIPRPLPIDNEFNKMPQARETFLSTSNALSIEERTTAMVHTLDGATCTFPTS